MGAKLRMLVLAHLCAVPFLNWLAGDRQFPEIAPVALLAEIDAQLMLVGIWFALGRQPLAWRILALVMAIVIVPLFWTWRFDVYLGAPATWDGWLMFAVFSAVDVLGVILVLLAAGMRYIVARAPAGESLDGVLQFSLRQLIAWVLLAGLLLAIGRFMREHEAGYTGDFLEASTLLFMAVSAGGYAMFALAATWIALRPARCPAPGRAALAAAAGAAISAWVAHCEGAVAEAVAGRCVHGAFAGVLVTGSLLVVRSGGWRLVEKHRRAAD